MPPPTSSNVCGQLFSFSFPCRGSRIARSCQTVAEALQDSSSATIITAVSALIKSQGLKSSVFSRFIWFLMEMHSRNQAWKATVRSTQSSFVLLLAAEM